MIRILILLLIVSTPIYAGPNDYIKWSSALFRDDGKAITGRLQYKIYFSKDSVDMAPVTISGSNTKYFLRDFEPGNYEARIASIEDGREGTSSETISFVIIDNSGDPKAPTKLHTGSLTECN